MSIAASSCSRFAIISWINDTLLLPLTKIEELGAGNVYCQLLDAAYPERVPLHKVKWDAKLQVDFLHNFKLLVTSFQFLGIDKKIDIQKLSKAKYQDNLEFVQWLKSFIQQKIDYSAYEPLKRRNYAKIYLGFANKVKFNVTLNSSNKQNLDNSTIMRSSVKSNSSMRSSVLTSSRSSVSILGNSNNKIKPLTDRQKPAKLPEKRKSIGPIAFVTLQNKSLNKNQSELFSYESKTQMKNVPIIESEGSQDQFFSISNGFDPHQLEKQ